MRALDRTRPYAQITPPHEGAVFMQDGAYFDLGGRFLRGAGQAASVAPSPTPAPSPAATPAATDGDGGGDLIAVEELGWKDLRNLSAKLGGPSGVGVNKKDVLAFLAEDGTTHVPRASLG